MILQKPHTGDRTKGDMDLDLVNISTHTDLANSSRGIIEGTILDPRELLMTIYPSNCNSHLFQLFSDLSSLKS